MTGSRSLEAWLPKGGGNVAAAAFIIAAASFASRILGVFRDRILASQFGAGDVLDVYYAAFRAPDFIYNLLIVGALSAGFIPVFIATRLKAIKAESKPDSHWYLVNDVLTIGVSMIVILAAIFVLFAHKIIPWVTPGFAPDKINEVISLSRIMFLSPILLSASAIIGGVLQSTRQWFIYSLAPIFYNIGIIIGALFFQPILGISGLAWGVVVGAAMHFLIQLPKVYQLGWRWHFVWDLKLPALREIGRLMIPRTLALSVTQINLLLLTALASYLAAGSVTIFNLAVNLSMVPVALIGISYAMAVFPILSEAVASDDKDVFRGAFLKTVRQIMFFIIPATVIIILLRAQIVRALLGSGAFDWSDTILTFETLRWLAVSLFAQALLPLLIRAFYAKHDTRTPLYIGVAGDITTLFISFYLLNSLGILALAIGFTVGSIVQVLGLWLALRIKIGNLSEQNLLWAVFQLTIAGFFMAFVTQGLKTGLGEFLGTATFITIAIQGTVSAFGGIVAYALVLLLFGSPELHELLVGVRRRLMILPVNEGIDETEGV